MTTEQRDSTRRQVLLVRANIVPLRKLTLRELINKTKRDVVKIKMESVLENIEIESDFANVIPVPSEVSSYIMSKILEEVKKTYLEFDPNQRKLELFNDLLVYALKYSFLPDFLAVKEKDDKNKEKDDEAVVPSPQDVFYAFYLANEEPTLGKLKQFIEDYVHNKSNKIVDVYRKLRRLKERVAPFAELAFYLLPADTRPGLNVSSLVSHMLMTSAITVALGGNEVERACALLHDVGKVKDPKHHTKAAEDFLKDLKDVFKDNYDEILECVKKHHSREANNKVRKADILASSLDRLTKLYEVFEKELRKCLSDGYEIIKNSFEAKEYKEREKSYEWIEKNFEKVKKASKFLANELLLPDHKVFKKLVEDTRGTKGKGSNVKLLVVDIGGIQKTLSDARKLRVLSGMSYFVELITHVIVPYIIISKLSLRPENIVFSGGGTVHAVVGSANVDFNKELEKYLAGPFGSLKIRIGTGDLERGFVLAVREAYEEIGRKKAEEVRKAPEANLVLIEAPGVEKCEWCQKRVGTVDVGGVKVCARCYSLWALTAPFGFGKGSARIALYKKLLEKEGRNGVTKNIEEKAIDVIREGEYVSFVAADGNFMGLFMSTSLSPTVYQEKSLRIDIATKRSLARLVSLLNSDYKKKFVLGFLYAGGDDFNAVLSPSLALVLGASFAYSFSAELGKKVSTSLGIATARHTAPIWELRDAAESLMDEKVKGMTREKAFECMRHKGECGGSLAALFVQGMLTKYSALHAFDEIYKEPLEAEQLLKALGKLVGREAKNDEEMKELIEELLWNLGSGKSQDVKVAMKELRKVIAKVGDDPVKLFYYITKTKDEEMKEKLKVLLEKPFFDGKKINLRLFDIIYKHLSRR